MKINVTVDLEDFYQHEDETLSESLIRAIECGVIDRLKREFKEKVQDDFYTQVIAKIVAEKEKETQALITELFEKKEVKMSKWDGGKKVSFAEYVEQCIINDNKNYNLDDKIKKVCDKVSADGFEALKKRYDIYFAAQIIEKLSAAGMLAQGVAESILKQS